MEYEVLWNLYINRKLTETDSVSEPQMDAHDIIPQRTTCRWPPVPQNVNHSNQTASCSEIRRGVWPRWSAKISPEFKLKFMLTKFCVSSFAGNPFQEVVMQNDAPGALDDLRSRWLLLSSCSQIMNVVLRWAVSSQSRHRLAPTPTQSATKQWREFPVPWY